MIDGGGSPNHVVLRGRQLDEGVALLFSYNDEPYGSMIACCLSSVGGM